MCSPPLDRQGPACGFPNRPIASSATFAEARFAIFANVGGLECKGDSAQADPGPWFPLRSILEWFPKYRAWFRLDAIGGQTTVMIPAAMASLRLRCIHLFATVATSDHHEFNHGGHVGLDRRLVVGGGDLLSLTAALALVVGVLFGAAGRGRGFSATFYRSRSSPILLGLGINI
jgi:hypothetical protein